MGNQLSNPFKMDLGESPFHITHYTEVEKEKKAKYETSFEYSYSSKNNYVRYTTIHHSKNKDTSIGGFASLLGGKEKEDDEVDDFVVGDYVELKQIFVRRDLTHGDKRPSFEKRISHKYGIDMTIGKILQLKGTYATIEYLSLSGSKTFLEKVWVLYLKKIDENEFQERFASLQSILRKLHRERKKLLKKWQGISRECDHSLEFLSKSETSKSLGSGPETSLKLRRASVISATGRHTQNYSVATSGPTSYNYQCSKCGKMLATEYIKQKILEYRDRQWFRQYYPQNRRRFMDQCVYRRPVGLLKLEAEWAVSTKMISKHEKDLVLFNTKEKLARDLVSLLMGK
mmetsp:Transcript_6445/g.9384  ORF Transcript_6445/g.9384 Transcript_6445/m.9384 type:complete len:343 (+) Transcript_6445:1636-2664(+)